MKALAYISCSVIVSLAFVLGARIIKRHEQGTVSLSTIVVNTNQYAERAPEKSLSEVLDEHSKAFFIAGVVTATLNRDSIGGPGCTNLASWEDHCWKLFREGYEQVSKK